MASQTMRIITRFVSFLKASATGSPSRMLVSKEPATHEITTLRRDDKGDDLEKINADMKEILDQHAYLDTSSPNSDLILEAVIRK